MCIRDSTQTVWDDEERTTPVNTVYGEFSDNGFQVTNGALKQTYGSLTMYYTPKNTYNGVVMTQRADGEGYDWKPYKYNSATSIFLSLIHILSCRHDVRGQIGGV